MATRGGETPRGVHAVTAFAYPQSPHVRRHGPRGYADYKHDKPWLRDEFSFRCGYCLCRETWLSDSEAHFGVDHVLSKSQAPDQSSMTVSFTLAGARARMTSPT
jgi:hypothetical protein